MPVARSSTTAPTACRGKDVAHDREPGRWGVRESAQVRRSTTSRRERSRNSPTCSPPPRAPRPARTGSQPDPRPAVRSSACVGRASWTARTVGASDVTSASTASRRRSQASGCVRLSRHAATHVERHAVHLGRPDRSDERAVVGVVGHASLLRDDTRRIPRDLSVWLVWWLDAFSFHPSSPGRDRGLRPAARSRRVHVERTGHEPPDPGEGLGRHRHGGRRLRTPQPGPSASARPCSRVLPERSSPGPATPTASAMRRRLRRAPTSRCC